MQQSHQFTAAIMTSFRFSLIVPFLLVASVFAQPDYQSKIVPPSGSPTIPVELGEIQLTNGNLHQSIPLGTFGQRGALSYSVALVYDSRIWVAKHFTSDSVLHHYPINISDSNIPDPRGYIGGGWRIVITSDNTTSKVKAISDTTGTCDAGNTFFHLRKGFSWVGPGGASHRWKSLFTLETNPTGAQCDGGVSGDSPTASGYADDGSGFYLTVGNYDQWVVYAPNGSQVYPVSIDTNGNYFTSGAFNSDGKDTMGRTPVLTSSSGNQIYYDVLNAQGGRSRYTVTTQSINVSVPNYSTTITVI